MKRNIVASILGVAASVASVASSYGQGSVLFANYGSWPGSPVQYSGVAGTVPAGKENLFVGSGFQAGLLYQFGAGALTPAVVNTDSHFFSTDAANQAAGAGYFNGGAVSIPGYTAGPITFTVQAFNGADYASSFIRGATTFTLNSIPTGLGLPGEFGALMPAFTVAIVPEPSTIALIGLGTGALLFLRRRKQ